MSTFQFNQSYIKPIFILGLLLSLAACSGVETKGIDNSDPYENVNRKIYGFNDGLDRAVLQPVAEGYTNITPEPVRSSITNFFDNITYLNVILNDILQGKFDQAMGDSLRFLYNSTLGIGGLFDVSTPMGLARHDEDFGQTLATWGVDQGAYGVLPLLGPDTARNTPNMVTEILLNPLTYVSGGVLIPVTALGLVNTRANLLDETQLRDDAAVDPYSFTREAYLQQREYNIYDGNPPLDGYDDIFEDEGTSTTGSSSDSGTLVIE